MSPSKTPLEPSFSAIVLISPFTSMPASLRPDLHRLLVEPFGERPRYPRRIHQREGVLGVLEEDLLRLRDPLLEDLVDVLRPLGTLNPEDREHRLLDPAGVLLSEAPGV